MMIPILTEEKCDRTIFHIQSNGVPFVPQSYISKAAGANPSILVLLKMATR
jgi:hypothetical protein